MASSEPTMARTMVFATIVATVLGLVVASAANLLAPRIATNKEVERKIHVLITTGVLRPTARPQRVEVETLYTKHILENSLTLDGTELPILLAIDNAGHTTALCIPLAGPGLWGPIRGYLALDASARRVLRITFYEHRETPGLGAEISGERWTSKWIGKSIVDASDQLVPIRVKRGAIDPLDPVEAAHAVDGISGATISGNAVAQLVRNGLETYQEFLEEQWRKN